MSGRSLSGQAGRASTKPRVAPGLGHSATVPNADEFEVICDQEEAELADEAELYAEASDYEVRCALALFRSLKRDFNQYRAVKVDGEFNWSITIPRTPEALFAALDTDTPSLEFAAAPLIARLDKWEATQRLRGGWMPPDGKRIEVRLGDLRTLRDATQGIEARQGADQQGLDAQRESPVANGDAPKPHSPTISREK
jgi:hypothetical protein